MSDKCSPMLDLAKTIEIPSPVELPCPQLKTLSHEPMPLASLRNTLSEVERACDQLRTLTVQAESHGEELRERAERAEEARRWLEQENKELHARLQRVEEKVPKWVRKLLGA